MQPLLSLHYYYYKLCSGQSDGMPWKGATSQQMKQEETPEGGGKGEDGDYRGLEHSIVQAAILISREHST